ncbi:MAG: hypothetical protein K2X77_23125 [Candidatus Obscuribacterales bacterium]|jgi:hypothetical protein|nr:hypothetical protein [Candidatus Obscuribacterales bacterium]
MRMIHRAFRFALVLPLVALIAGAACADVRSGNAAPVSSYEPQVPTTPPLVLMHETTGELWRTTHRSSKGTVTKIEVGYQDGRRGVYKFDDAGKVRSFSSYKDVSALHYEAEFGPTGLITSSRTLNDQGVTTESFRRLPDGQEETLRFDAEGNVTEAVIDMPDGSRKTVRSNGLLPAQVEQIASASNLKELVAQTGGKFKVTLKGAAMESWEYYSADGKLRQKGLIKSDGSLEITQLDDYGKPKLRQTWQLNGQDWSQRFYSLQKVEDFDWNGNVSSATELHSDGRTPKAKHQYWSGRHSYTEFFDAQGYRTHSQYYNSDGSPSSVYQQSREYRSKGDVAAASLEEPKDNGKSLYRLQGNPFAAQPSKQHEVSPLIHK